MKDQQEKKKWLERPVVLLPFSVSDKQSYTFRFIGLSWHAIEEGVYQLKKWEASAELF